MSQPTLFILLLAAAMPLGIKSCNDGKPVYDDIGCQDGVEDDQDGVYAIQPDAVAGYHIQISSSQYWISNTNQRDSWRSLDPCADYFLCKYIMENGTPGTECVNIVLQGPNVLTCQPKIEQRIDRFSWNDKTFNSAKIVQPNEYHVSDSVSWYSRENFLNRKLQQLNPDHCEEEWPDHSDTFRCWANLTSDLADQ